MSYGDDELLMLSGLQHFAFCRRQWALIHVEQQWQENLRTVEGQLLHQRAHDITLREHRGNVLLLRSMAVVSRELGLSGQCDVVEFHQDPTGVPPCRAKKGCGYPILWNTSEENLNPTKQMRSNCVPKLSA